MDSKINYDKVTEEIRKFVMGAVSESRYAHSMRTAQMCKKLCERYGLDPERGYLCGVAHDMCKKMDDELLTSIASRDGKPISDLEKEKPALLHGRAAAVKIESDFGIHDEQIIQNDIADQTDHQQPHGQHGASVIAHDFQTSGHEHENE